MPGISPDIVTATGRNQMTTENVTAVVFDDAMLREAKARAAGYKASITRVTEIDEAKRTPKQRATLATATGALNRLLEMFPALKDITSSAWEMPTTLDDARGSYRALKATLTRATNEKRADSEPMVVTAKARLARVIDAFPDVETSGKTKSDDALDALLARAAAVRAASSPMAVAAIAAAIESAAAATVETVDNSKPRLVKASKAA
jgi:hypothetical protein